MVAMYCRTDTDLWNGSINLILFLFFNIEKGWDMCLNLSHEMNPMMDIDSKLHNFPSIKLYNPNIF